LNVWKTNPISWFRIRASSSSSRSRISVPRSLYEPLVGVSRQPITFISVDLPDPDGPMTARYSPDRIESETPARACTSLVPIT
jgi:hypothetical protein